MGGNRDLGAPGDQNKRKKYRRWSKISEDKGGMVWISRNDVTITYATPIEYGNMIHWIFFVDLLSNCACAVESTKRWSCLATNFVLPRIPIP